MFFWLNISMDQNSKSTFFFFEREILKQHIISIIFVVLLLLFLEAQTHDSRLYLKFSESRLQSNFFGRDNRKLGYMELENLVRVLRGPRPKYFWTYFFAIMSILRCRLIWLKKKKEKLLFRPPLFAPRHIKLTKLLQQ